MAKAAKIDDIKRPDKVAPNPTSRPVLVTNRPTLKNDPMMTSDDTKSEEGSESIPMTHSAKIIVPINADVVPDPDPAESADPPKDSEDVAKEEGGDQNLEDATQPKTGEDSDSEPAEKEPAPPASVEHDTKASLPSTDSVKLSATEDDSETEVTAEEAALAEEKARREQEVEDIIASGKYVVPIDAVQRRRSRAATMLLSLLALVLAVILIDAVLDVGIVHVPSGIPHTHFFSKH